MAGKILVTGASGLVGDAVLRAVARAGREAIALSRERPAAGLAGVVPTTCDLAAPGAARLLAELPGIAVVLHCAAQIPVSFSGEHAAQVAAANERMDAAVIGFCAARGIRLVYCSSVAVYGMIERGPVDESAVVAPRGPYAAAKLASEQKIGNVLGSYANLRLCAPYGPGQRSRTVLRIFVERAKAGEVLSYHGSGAREQDFLHARDAAGALLHAADRPGTSGTFNVCSGAPISMKNLAELVVREVGSPGARVCAADTPDAEEQYRGRFDNSLAALRLGWRPKISLAEGLRELAGGAAS
jgi:UDP-glucose 4-epimerase